MDASFRTAGRDALAGALQAARRDTLARLADWRAAGRLQVPRIDTLNPPAWELGHVGWFQHFWIGRNPDRARGMQADPLAPRPPGEDAWYDSSQVPHDARWSLPLPDVERIADGLAQQLDTTLALLAEAPETDEGLYFFRLALAHEDMHHEAAVYMQRALGVPVSDPRWRTAVLVTPRTGLRVDAARHRLGWCGPGFAFDNELGAHEVGLAAYEIDSRVLTWGEYRAHADPGARGGADDEPVCGISWFEALDWCARAGRRLPTEAEWEHAALTQGDAFCWGQVWEWTASPFAPFPGFVPHPYRDYSAPWFDGRPVLRGASFATSPRFVHPRFRNFFRPERTDILAGLRTCAPQR